MKAEDIVSLVLQLWSCIVSTISLIHDLKRESEMY